MQMAFLFSQPSGINSVLKVALFLYIIAACNRKRKEDVL